MLIDIGLKFYAVPALPTFMTLRSRSQAWIFCVKVLVKLFISLYVLKMYMYQVDTLHVARYWS